MFVPLEPVRLLDTATGKGAPAGRLRAAGDLDRQVTGTPERADGRHGGHAAAQRRDAATRARSPRLGVPVRRPHSREAKRRVPAQGRHGEQVRDPPQRFDAGPGVGRRPRAATTGPAAHQPGQRADDRDHYRARGAPRSQPATGAGELERHGRRAPRPARLVRARPLRTGAPPAGHAATPLRRQQRPAAVQQRRRRASGDRDGRDAEAGLTGRTATLKGNLPLACGVPTAVFSDPLSIRRTLSARGGP